MNSRERVRAALKFVEPDRVPVDYWADAIVTDRLMKALSIESKDELLKKLEIDFRFIEGTVYSGPALDTYEDGSKKDIWGVCRKKILVDPSDPDKGDYVHAVEHPLAYAESIKDVEKYQGWPSIEWYDYSQVERQCDQFEGYTVICGGDRLNRTAQLKPSMYLRGMEQIMIDLALNGKIVEAIFEKLVDFYIGYNREIFEKANGKIDIFFMGDDFGTQHGLIMSIDMWKKFIKPGFRKFIELAHKHGLKVMHHTCGAISELIPEFIDCGLDILQSLQPRAQGMDFNRLKREYGRDICFQGGIDIQNTMPHGTPEDIKKEVMDRIRTLAPGGGYIICTAHNMQADVPVENSLALFEAAREYGRY